MCTPWDNKPGPEERRSKHKRSGRKLRTKTGEPIGGDRGLRVLKPTEKEKRG